MSASAPTLFARLLWLLAGSIVLVMLLALLVLRITSSDVAARAAARGMALQVAAADVLAADADVAALARRGVRLRRAAPPGSRMPLGPMHRFVDELRAQLPGRELRLQMRPERLLWVRAQAPAVGWIGLPVLRLRGTLARAAVLTLVLGALVALGAAAGYARSLTAPLRRMAAAAPEIAAGAAPPPLPPRSVRELHELDAALAAAAEGVRRAAAERELLLAALSHDLRTPLARLRLGLELGADGVEAELRRGMERDIEAIDALAAQFVDFVRDGRDEPTRRVDLAGLVRELAALAAPLGFDWPLRVPPSLAVHGKPLALRRALDNLMQNAQRHGAPPFRAELARQGDRVRLCIVDHGPGAPPALLQRLGEPFLRGDSARGGDGSGLGLASVRRVAALHGGALHLRNRPQGGFEACLELPAG